MKHEFCVGQIVELKPSILLRLAASGEYEITHLMPEPDVNSASPRYRIKSREEVYHRVVSEDELAVATRSVGEDEITATSDKALPANEA